MDRGTSEEAKGGLESLILLENVDDSSSMVGVDLAMVPGTGKGKHGVEQVRVVSEKIKVDMLNRPFNGS